MVEARHAHDGQGRHAKTHLSGLLARVEAGEDIIIARGDRPIARLTRLAETPDVETTIADILAARDGPQTTTLSELLSLRHDSCKA